MLLDLNKDIKKCSAVIKHIKHVVRHVEVYLALVGELHQLAHESSGLRALRVTHLLHLQVTLCQKQYDMNAGDI